MERVTVKLVGEDGNVFNVIGKITRALKDAGQADKAGEFQRKALSSESYDAVLQLAFNYVEIE